MAGVPCVNDTCSVNSTVDTNGRLNINVNLKTNGGLECAEGEGVAASIFGDPAAVAPGTLTDCDNLLGVTTDNDLFARRPGFEVILVNGDDAVDVPNSAGAFSDYSTDFVVENNADCTRIAIINTQLVIAFNADAGGHDAMFSFEYGFNSISGTVGGGGTTTRRATVGGDVPINGSFRVHSQDVTTILLVGAGASFQARSRCQRAVVGQNVDSAGASLGFSGAHRIALLDLASGNLIS